MNKSNNKISFWPNSTHQWFRIMIGLIGVIVAIITMCNKITIETMATVVTLLGFMGYAVDGLFSNVYERKNEILRGKKDIEFLEKELNVIRESISLFKDNVNNESYRDSKKTICDDILNKLNKESNKQVNVNENIGDDILEGINKSCLKEKYIKYIENKLEISETNNSYLKLREQIQKKLQSKTSEQSKMSEQLKELLETFKLDKEAVLAKSYENVSIACISSVALIAGIISTIITSFLNLKNIIIDYKIIILVVFIGIIIIFDFIYICLVLKRIEDKGKKIVYYTLMIEEIEKELKKINNKSNF